jgi:hypothetical protein
VTDRYARAVMFLWRTRLKEMQGAAGGELDGEAVEVKEAEAIAHLVERLHCVEPISRFETLLVGIRT